MIHISQGRKCDTPVFYYLLQVTLYIVGATMSDFGLPWDLLDEIDFLV